RVRWRAKHRPPSAPRHDKADAARQPDEQNAPASAGNRLANGTEAGPDDKTDERGDSTQPRDHAGLLDHWRPDSHDVLDATCGRPRTKSRGTPTVRARLLLTQLPGYNRAFLSKHCVPPPPIV